MSIDRAAWPFVLGTLAPAAGLFLLRRPRAALPFAALAGFMLFFFRDPERIPPEGESLVLAPADGRVMYAGDGQAGVAPPGAWTQISIFLSPMDVHINRVPVTGIIRRIEDRPGRFLPAYKPESGQENERNELWIDSHGQTVVARQVVGMLARRIVCRVVEGEHVAAGQRFGLMKFGSRMDVFVPPGSRLVAREGEHIRGGESVMAILPTADDPR